MKLPLLRWLDVCSSDVLLKESLWRLDGDALTLSTSAFSGGIHPILRWCGAFDPGKEVVAFFGGVLDVPCWGP